MLDKIKEIVRTANGKIGLGIIIFGILAIVATQASRNGTTIGQSILVGGIFILIGLVVIKLGSKKKAEPLITGSVNVSALKQEHEKIDLTPLPIDVIYSNTDKPSERQVKYATERFGIKILEGHCFADVSQMISRYEESDYNKPPLALAQYALSIGAEVTPYVGANHIIGQILGKLSKSEQIAFYAYAVYCSALGKELGDLRTSPYYDKFIEFGKSKADDARFLKSIENRPKSDYYKPNHNTIAYTAVLELIKSF